MSRLFVRYILLCRILMGYIAWKCIMILISSENVGHVNCIEYRVKICHSMKHLSHIQYFDIMCVLG